MHACISLKKLPNSLGRFVFFGDHWLSELGGDAEDFEYIAFFGFFGHKLVFPIEGGASKMCEVIQCRDYPIWGAQKFMKRTSLDKMHAYARACGTNSIFTSTTNNVLKGEGYQWRLPYVNMMRWTIVVICFSHFQANYIGVMKPHVDDNISLHSQLFNEMLGLRLVKLLTHIHCT
jgi:hypothetical protein